MSQISVNHLTFYYEGSYDNIFEDVSFQIDTNWKLGFIARNGKGKTTFLKLLMGQYEYKGSISASVIFDYFPFGVKNKARNTVDIIEEIDSDYEFWKICRELNCLKVDADVLYRPFDTLSNGEQNEVHQLVQKKQFLSLLNFLYHQKHQQSLSLPCYDNNI